MRFRNLVIVGIASGLALSTGVEAKPKVTTDAVPGASVGSFRTYTWVDSAPPGGLNPVQYQRIMADFDAALASKGFQKGPTGDLTLALTIGAKQKTDIETWGRWGLQTSVYQYTQGQLSVDVFDSKTKQALWHGQVSDTINPDKPNPAKVDAAISKLMEQFPASSGAATPSQ
jgi:Domain of unknown function (DUF4136)